MNHLFAYCTVSAIACVCVTPPSTAFTVSVALPTTAVDAAFSVRVLLPLPEAMLVGANVAVTPFGSPVTVSATADRNPFTGAAVTVTVPDAPRVTIAVALPTASVKLGTITVKLNA